MAPNISDTNADNKLKCIHKRMHSIILSLKIIQ